MREIILTNELKERILTPDNFLGKGNEGRVFKYSDSETIKIYYGIFNDYIFHSDRKPNDIELDASETYHNRILDLELRQNLIGRTSLPKGRVTLNGLTIGCILKYHGNHFPLVMHYFEDDETVLKTFREVCKSVNELTTYCIYPTDVHEQNILIEKKTNMPELIDVDGEYIHITDLPNQSDEDETYYKTMLLIINYIRLKKSNNPAMSDEEVFESINISPEFIQLLLRFNPSYEEIMELINYLSKDKILEKAPTYRLIKRPF